MPTHITFNYVQTLCGRPVGELADDSYTTDIIVATSPSVEGCPECLEALDRPRRQSDVVSAADQAYELGYQHGKDRAWFELDIHDPLSHEPGCTCNPCSTARNLLRKLLGGVDDVA